MELKGQWVPESSKSQDPRFQHHVRGTYPSLSPSAIFSTPPFKSSKFPSLFFCPNISLCLSLKLHCSSFIS
ncbi:hypothetical protein L1887_00015 [Cichorium endivia]|nr:hypothetical protein L1887_00015 [Cichorium endivia]